MRLRGRLAGSYLAAVALVIFALVPYLVLTSQRSSSGSAAKAQPGTRRRWPRASAAR